MFYNFSKAKNLNLIRKVEANGFLQGLWSSFPVYWLYIVYKTVYRKFIKNTEIAFFHYNLKLDLILYVVKNKARYQLTDRN